MALTENNKMVKEYDGVLYSIKSNYAILERLKQYEDIGLNPFEASVAKEAYDVFKDMPTCNTCAAKQSCQYVTWGDPVVYRCPHYVGETITQRG